MFVVTLCFEDIHVCSSANTFLMKIRIITWLSFFLITDRLFLVFFKVDEIYHDESLGTNINIILVRMIMVGYRQVSRGTRACSSLRFQCLCFGVSAAIDRTALKPMNTAAAAQKSFYVPFSFDWTQNKTS